MKTCFVVALVTCFRIFSSDWKLLAQEVSTTASTGVIPISKVSAIVSPSSKVSAEVYPFSNISAVVSPSPPAMVLFKGKMISTIFDDVFGMYSVSDWLPENGVRCETNTLAENVCTESCSSNKGILSIGLCINGWVTCAVSKVNKTEVVNRWRDGRLVPTQIYSVQFEVCQKDVTDCLELCYSSCKVNGLPSATIKPFFSGDVLLPRGCTPNGHCLCAPFNKEFKHPVPPFNTPYIATQMHDMNATYYQVTSLKAKADKMVDEIRHKQTVKKIKSLETEKKQMESEIKRQEAYIKRIKVEIKRIEAALKEAEKRKKNYTTKADKKQKKEKKNKRKNGILFFRKWLNSLK